VSAHLIPAHFDVTVLLPPDSEHTTASLRDEIQSWLEDLTRGEVIAIPLERDTHEQAETIQSETPSRTSARILPDYCYWNDERMVAQTASAFNDVAERRTRQHRWSAHRHDVQDQLSLSDALAILVLVALAAFALLWILQ